jgi:hypothetical protein
MPLRNLPWLFRALPAAAALVVVAAVLAGQERPVRAARLLGGPPEGSRHAWRVELLEVHGTASRPLAGVALSVRAGSTHQSITTGPGGIAEMQIEATEHGPARVSLVEMATGQVLAGGSVQLSPQVWAQPAGRRGGWLAGHRAGALHVDVAPRRGVLAVPFEDALLVRVEHAGEGVADARVALACDGIAVLAGASAKTDARGVAEVRIAPRDHAPSCSVTATRGDLEGTFHGVLPVVPGALNATREGSHVRIESPTPAAFGYVALVTPEARLGAHAVPLVEADGRAQGRVRLAPAEQHAQFAVVSSEADFRSPALVGWPLESSADAPATTFDVRDVLLLDGLPDARARERARSAAVLWRSVAAIGALGLAAIGMLWYEGRLTRRGRSASPGGPWWLLFGLVVALGFGAYALAVWIRLRSLP